MSKGLDMLLCLLQCWGISGMDVWIDIFSLSLHWEFQPMLCLSICGTAPFKIQTARECPQPPAVLFSVEPRWVGFSFSRHWPASLHLVPLCAACSKTCRRLASTLLEPRFEGWYKLIHCLCDFSVPVLTQLQIVLLFCPLFPHHPAPLSTSSSPLFVLFYPSRFEHHPWFSCFQNFSRAYFRSSKDFSSLKATEIRIFVCFNVSTCRCRRATCFEVQSFSRCKVSFSSSLHLHSPRCASFEPTNVCKQNCLCNQVRWKRPSPRVSTKPGALWRCRTWFQVDSCY